MCSKRALLVTLLIYSYHFIQAQTVNLIKDPSFEKVTNNVNGSGQESLLYWRNLDSTRPDACRFVYMSYITQNQAFSLPDNLWCYQHPHSGNGIIDFGFQWSATPGFKRSLCRIKLNSKLDSGRVYCAKMYVNPCDKYNGYFTDGIDMYFDDGSLSNIVATDSSGVYPYVIPQISNVGIITDTLGWTEVKGEFTANGTETYLTLGNFRTDANTNLLLMGFPGPIALATDLLIDDVSVYPKEISNWLHDVTCAEEETVYIGLPEYDMPEAVWYDIHMNPIDTASGIYVVIPKQQPITQFIQGIKIETNWYYDTLTVYANPTGLDDVAKNEGLQIELFPNSTKSNNGFNIKTVSKTNCRLNVRIINMNGQQLLNQNYVSSNGNSFINIHFKTGTYMVLITDQKTKQIIKRKLEIVN